MKTKLAGLVVVLGSLLACGDSSNTGAAGTGAGDTGGGGTGGGTGAGDTGGGGTGGTTGGGGTGGSPGVLPEPCPDTPVQQSPAIFGPNGIEPEIAETCETTGSEWIPCHQHMHCEAEHSGAGICGEAECEIHTVHRKRKDGGETAEVKNIHEGTVGGNCVPADHDILVRATFMSFAKGCEAGTAQSLTYCGSATGNNMLDTDTDGEVTCLEAGINPTSVRWCLQTECLCVPGSTPEEQEAEYGEIEATKAQGCSLM